MINQFRRHLLLFVLVSCSFTSIWAYTVQEYEDLDNIEFFNSGDNINNGLTYPGGTGLMQLYTGNNFTNLYIRLLHPNGTLTKLTSYDPDLFIQYAYPLKDGYVFIIQIKNKDGSHIYGKLMDWTGQVLQR